MLATTTMSTSRGATLTSSVVNTVNTIIGSGILVLPYAFRTDSILLGTSVVVFAGLANAIGMILQGAASKFVPRGTATFFTVCRATYPKLSVIFDLAIFAQCFGVNVSYLVLSGDTMPMVFSFKGWDAQAMKIFYILSSLVLVVPLCLMRKIDSLRYASVVALIAIVYICALIYGNFFYAVATDYRHIPVDKIGPVSFWKPEGIKPVFKTLGIIVLAYTCPTQFSIVTELENPTMHRITRIVYISMTLTATLFVTVALSGYLTFGNALNGNILMMYDDSILTTIGRGLLTLMIILSFPLMFHPARVSFNNVYHVLSEWWKENKLSTESELLQINDSSPLLSSEGATAFSNIVDGDIDLDPEDVDEDVPMSDTRFYVLSFVLLMAAYTTSLLLNSFELILAIVGSTGGVLISFVLPGFYGYKLIASEEEEVINRLYRYAPSESANPIFRSKLLKKISLFLIIWGLAVMFICLYSSIFE